MTHDDLFKLMKEIDPRTERVPAGVQRLADALEARFNVQLAAKQAQIDALKLEYCPNEVLPQFLIDEIKHQLVTMDMCDTRFKFWG